MTSPGGKEVGRVSVRVVPDTSKFREQLKKDLENLPDVEIAVSPNLNKFKEKLKAEVAAAAVGTKVEVPVELDTKNLQQVGKSIQQALTAANMPNFLGDMSRLDMIMRRVIVNAQQIRTSLLGASNTVRDWTKAAVNVRSHFEGISKTVQNIRGHVGLIRFDSMQKGVQRVSDSIRRIPGYIGLIRFGSIQNGLNQGASALQTFGDRSRSVFSNVGSILATVGRGIRSLVSTIATGLGNAISTVGGMLPRILGSGLEKFGESLQNMGAALDDVGKKGASSGKSVATALLAAAQAGIALTGAFLQLGGIAAALVVAGAAITAAWGLAATAIAAIPSAIFALAGPLAAVMIGMEGLKRAAQTLKPEFEKLQTTVENTFEKGMRPAFERLRPTMATLQTGLVGITDAVSLVARSIADIIAVANRAGTVTTIFNNIRGSIEGMKPGIDVIIASLIQLGAQKAVFDLLTSAVNTFGAEWSKSVQKTIGDGSFERAMSGLSGIIDSLTKSLVGLVTNGLYVLAGAAPGIQSFFDSLNGFFGQFNWERLGASVGKVFDGIAKGIQQVDPGTIKAIEDAFVRLGDVFQSPAFQNSLSTIIEFIPAVIDALGFLSSAFIQTASGVVGSIQVIQGTTDSISKFFEGDWLGADAAAQRAVEGWRAIGDAFTGGGDTTATAASGAAQKAKDALTQGFGNIPPDVQRELDKLPPAVRESLGQLSPVTQSALATLPTVAGAVAAEVPGAVQQGLAPVPDTARAIFDQIAPGMTSAFQSLSGVATTGMGDIERSVGDGMVRIRDLFTRGFETMAPLVGLAFTGMRTTVDTEMAALVTSVTTHLTTLLTQFNVTKTELATFGIAFTNLGTQVVAFGVLLVTLNTNLTTLSTSFGVVNTGLLTANTSLTAMNVVLTTLNATLVLINTALTTLGTSLITLNTNLGLLIVGFTNLNLGLTTLTTTLVLFGTQISALNLSFPMLITHLQNLNIALTTLNTSLPVLAQNFTLFLNAVTLLIPGIQALVLELTNLSTAFTTLQTTVLTAMDAIVLSVTDGLVRMNTAWAEALTLWVTLVTSGMAAVTSAIATGMGDAVSSVESGIRLMEGALRAGVQAFRQAGADMGQGLVDGLKSKLSAVRAAAAQLANAAAAALRLAAQVKSPSRVFMRIGAYMGDGLAIGLDNSTNGVRTAAQKLTGEAVKAAQNLQDAFRVDGWSEDIKGAIPSAVSDIKSVSTGTWTSEVSAGDFGGLSDAVETALSGWNVQIDGNGMAKLVNKSNTRKNRRR